MLSAMAARLPLLAMTDRPGIAVGSIAAWVRLRQADATGRPDHSRSDSARPAQLQCGNAVGMVAARRPEPTGTGGATPRTRSMRPEIQTIVDEIKQALSLLRRHL
ncbi:hypothetical protein [Prosthecomicrobium hirschii]|uniref:hypothetical protein n=1 Tax=Prosthecodimorpha hirschii TaxID=665126 RepID=UPI00221F2B98|nr:hypothetical protein [Prosthecomicrobium hirschii]MCW1839112.1 hypothetical protein [Prosthecomicrobium hirschii]